VVLAVAVVRVPSGVLHALVWVVGSSVCENRTWAVYTGMANYGIFQKTMTVIYMFMYRYMI